METRGFSSAREDIARAFSRSFVFAAVLLLCWRALFLFDVFQERKQENMMKSHISPHTTAMMTTVDGEPDEVLDVVP